MNKENNIIIENYIQSFLNKKNLLNKTKSINIKYQISTKYLIYTTNLSQNKPNLLPRLTNNQFYPHQSKLSKNITY